MKLRVTITMDNAAFEDAPGYELARILRELAGKLDGYGAAKDTTIRLMDANGNTVGQAVIL
jgi:hypothetical protein